MTFQCSQQVRLTTSRVSEFLRSHQLDCTPPPLGWPLIGKLMSLSRASVAYLSFQGLILWTPLYKMRPPLMLVISLHNHIVWVSSAIQVAKGESLLISWQVHHCFTHQSFFADHWVMKMCSITIFWSGKSRMDVWGKWAVSNSTTIRNKGGDVCGCKWWKSPNQNYTYIGSTTDARIQKPLQRHYSYVFEWRWLPDSMGHSSSLW